jgi:hypothetical protein
VASPSAWTVKLVTAMRIDARENTSLFMENRSS